MFQVSSSAQAQPSQARRRPLFDALAVRMERATVLYARFWLAMPDTWLKRRVVASFLARSSAALNRQDYDVYFLGFRDDAVWRVAGDVPGAGTHTGLAAIRHYLDDYFSQWQWFENRPLEVLGARPHRVAFTSELRARGARSGATVRQFESYVVEMERGWVVKLHEFRRRDSALAAYEADDPGSVDE